MASRSPRALRSSAILAYENPNEARRGRFALIGLSDRGRLLFVVHEPVTADLTRIISPRRVTPHEGKTMKKKASRVSHAPPSKSSLREMPEQRFVPGKSRRNPYAARIREEGLTFQIDGEAPIVLREGAGRPKNGEGVGASRPHSVRLPDAVWRQLEARARREGTTAHALLRAAIAGFLRTG